MQVTIVLVSAHTAGDYGNFFHASRRNASPALAGPWPDIPAASSQDR